MPKIFPDMSVDNRVIMVCGKGARNGFSTLISNTLPDLNNLEAGTQCFPLKLYEANDDNSANKQSNLFDVQPQSSEGKYRVKDGLSDAGLKHFQQAYPDESISKEDIFYYVYGLLHSPDYQTRYANNLSKALPCIPCVQQARDFWTFSQAGRDLAELHLNYETVACYPVTLETAPKKLKDNDYYVRKMKFAKKGDLSTVIYNAHITIKDIPLQAYDYVVNGKPALAWVMERQAVTTDKKSGIVNDANLWATETMHNAKYPLELFQRVITVSLESMKIVQALPELDIS